MAKQLFDEQMIARMIKRISYEIVEKNKGTDDLVLAGIKTRGVYIAKRISEFIGSIENAIIPTVDIDITPFRDDVENFYAEVTKTKNKNVDLQDKNVILVDDVLYTGRTIRAAMSAILEYGRPKMIQLAVIVDRGHRELPIRPDYTGKNIPTAKFEDVVVKLIEKDDEDAIYLR